MFGLSLSLGRKVKLIEAFYRYEWMDESDSDETLKILSDSKGREFWIEFTPLDLDVRYNFVQRLSLDRQGYLSAKYTETTNHVLRARLFKANTTDRKELVKFWQNDDPCWKGYYEWNLSGAFDNGHTILEIIPYGGDVNFCSLRCQSSEESQTYYIHYDDGDLHVSFSPEWSDLTVKPIVYGDYAISYAELRSQSGFETI